MHFLELVDKVLRSFASDGLCDGSDCHIGVKKKDDSVSGIFIKPLAKSRGLGYNERKFDTEK